MASENNDGTVTVAFRIPVEHYTKLLAVHKQVQNDYGKRVSMSTVLRSAIARYVEQTEATK